MYHTGVHNFENQNCDIGQVPEHETYANGKSIISLSEEVEHLQWAAEESQKQLKVAKERIKNLESELKATRFDANRLRKRCGSVARNHLDQQDI